MTDRVHPDEECHGYFTGPKLMPGFGEEEAERMIEQVFVIRGDAIACYERDFGPANDFIYVPPLMMPSFGENPVGLMQEFGERHRNDPRWAKRIIELKQSSTLFADILRQEEQKPAFIHNRSVFGPHQTTQRNAVPKQAVIRAYKDKRALRTGKRVFYPS